MTNLATIQRVKQVQPCPDSDNLDLIQILGWQVVTKRGEYKENDLVIYVAIDTVLPDRPEFEFLRNKHFRIKPIRLRKQESAGIVFPLSILEKFDYHPPSSFEEGVDVTSFLKILKYEKPMPPELAGMAFGSLPGFLKMTDEDNLRSYPDAIPELYGRPYYITRKDDGCSGTFFNKDKEFGVTSRKIHLKDTESNGFWKMARKYDIANIITTAFPDMDIAIQGEVVGPGIQQNKLGLKELEFHLFNLFDIKKQLYMDYSTIVDFTTKYNIPMVTEIDSGTAFGYTLDELIAMSNKLKYPTDGPAEGIVIRPKESFYSTILKRHWTGKIINENYKD